MINKLNAYLVFFGIDIKKGWQTTKSLRWFLKDKKQLQEQLAGNNEFTFNKLQPIFSDKFDNGGTIAGHYFHQDLHVAQRVYQNRPVKHVDIASRIDGFVAHVATFREIEVFDIRPIISKTKNITFTQADFAAEHFDMANYTDSISCLHAIEHFGLGRYNDPIDAFGHLKGLDNIYKLLKPGGKFYLSTPIGPQRIEFNAQRVFSISYLLGIFKNKYHIETFSYVDDAGDLHTDIKLQDEKEIRENFGCHYGCGIFEMVKL